MAGNSAEAVAASRWRIDKPRSVGQFAGIVPQLPRRVFLASCAGLAAGGQAFAAGGPAKPPAAAAVITVGVLLPLSGGQSLVGDECLRGISLAAADINTAGGIGGARLNLVAGDAAGQNRAGGTAQSLLNAGHAALLLGSGASDLSYAGSAAAELAQIPYIELNAAADGITARGFRFLLRSGLTTADIADSAIAGINARYQGKQIGLLFNTGATAGAVAAAALANLQAAKIPVLLSIGYPPDQADLHEPVARLMRAGVEVLLHAADPDDVLIFFAGLQGVGWKPAAIFGAGDGYMLRETAYALGDALDGVFVAAAPFYPPRAAYIADAYQAAFGMQPRSAQSLTAYVGAKLVFDKLTEAGGDVTKLLAALRKSDIPAGTLANGWGVAFDKSGQNTRSFAVLQRWKNAVLTQLV